VAQRGFVGNDQLNYFGRIADFLGGGFGASQITAGNDDFGTGRGELFGGGIRIALPALRWSTC
jgi:hypothetical protein